MAAKETGNAQAEKVTVSTFSKNDLIASAAVFNTTPAIMTGALYGVKKRRTYKTGSRGRFGRVPQKTCTQGGKVKWLDCTQKAKARF